MRSERLERGVNGREGNALLMALVIMIPLLIMGLTVMQLGIGAGSELSAESDQARAQYLAEAGVAEAVTAMRLDLSGDVGAPNQPALLQDGLVWVQATPLGNDRTRLLAVGMKGSGRAALDVVVSRTQSQVYSMGFVSSRPTDLATEMFADSFDSDLGSYASQVPAGSDHARSNAFIASNEDITIGQHSIVHGDARPGPAGGVNLKSATVTGSTTPNKELFTMDPVDVPGLPAGGQMYIKSGTQTLAPGTHRFTDIELESKTALVIPGPATVVIDGDVKLGSSTTLVIGAGGPVTIYIGGDLRMGTNSSLETPSLDAHNATLFMTGENTFAELKSHSGFYGTFYGPRTTVELDNVFEMYGALAAEQFYAANTKLRLHFDEALARKAQPWAWDFDTVSWLPAGFPDPQLARDRRDPFQVLGLNAASLRPASDYSRPAYAQSIGDGKLGGL